MLYQLSSLVMYFSDIKHLDLELIFTSLVYCWLGFIAGEPYISLTCLFSSSCTVLLIHIFCPEWYICSNFWTYIDISSSGKVYTLFHFTPDLTNSKFARITKALPFFIEYFHSLNSSLLYLLSPPPTQLWQCMASFSIT